ncbi:acetyl-CoA synthetase-like protein [Thozetella sp. PMI_491]|nr:acetyl-CoA synthetase-like protein [Thozetella sp. PMI_491]
MGSIPETELSSILPNFPLFVRLLGFANRFSPTRPAITDLTTGTAISHAQLLRDVLSLRAAIYKTLDREIRQKLADDEEVFLMLLSGPGYDYVVGFLAILALGAAVVPVSPHVPLQEALYFADRSTASGVVFHSLLLATTSAIQERKMENGASVFPTIEITSSLGLLQLLPSEISIHHRHSLNPEKAGLVIFTSGTTGRPKAVILPREILSAGALALADHFELTPDDVALHCMPVHHIAGISVCFIPFLFSGARLEFDGFDVQRVWDRWRQGGLTVFGGVPTMFTRLMRHYEDHIRGFPEEKSYVDGLRSLRFMMSGTAAVPAPLRAKWTSLTGGKRLLERYGASEYSTAILTPLHDNYRVPDGSVGETLSGCQVKLAADGQILIKAPGMFLRYLQDPKATKEAFDENGFYKTGDIGELHGRYWFIKGRASIDIIKSGGYKISSLDIEREMLGLDYISEACVVGVPDEEFGQRVAAIAVLRKMKSLSLTKLRDDLRASLSGYKLPTLLYVADELPKTISGKVQKRALGKDIFESGKYRGCIQVFVPKNKSPADIRPRL